MSLLHTYSIWTCNANETSAYTGIMANPPTTPVLVSHLVGGGGGGTKPY